MGFWNSTKVFFGFEEEEDSIEESTRPPIDRPASTPSAQAFKAKLVQGKNPHSFPASEIKIEEPRIYEDSLNISSYLRENKPCIVNLKYLDSDAGKRLIDFVCGTAYAINGHMMKIGENIFLFTPANINITENQQERSTFETGVQENAKATFMSHQEPVSAERSTYEHHPKTAAERLAERRAERAAKEAHASTGTGSSLPLP